MPVRSTRPVPLACIFPLALFLRNHKVGYTYWYARVQFNPRFIEMIRRAVRVPYLPAGGLPSASNVIHSPVSVSARGGCTHRSPKLGNASPPKLGHARGGCQHSRQAQNIRSKAQLRGSVNGYLCFFILIDCMLLPICSCHICSTQCFSQRVFVSFLHKFLTFKGHISLCPSRDPQPRQV